MQYFVTERRANCDRMEKVADIDALNENDAPFVEDYLLYLLAASSHALSREFHALVKKKGMKVNEWRVLACLNDRPGLMLTELAELVLFEQSHLTKIIDRMSAQGLVERAKTVDDRRKVLIQITAKGKELVEPLIIAAKQHEERAVREIDRRDMADLKRILKQLIRCNRQ